jgi:monoamine oxidase
MQKPEPVIVIGAGVAGLACARELLRLGFAPADVVVLEARARIGGRVWSDERLGFPVDLGASWIMGHRSNPLSEIARAGGAELVPTDWDTLAAYHKGARVPERDLDRIAEEYEELLDEIEAGGRSLSSDITIAAAIERALRGETLSSSERHALDFAFAMLGIDAAADMDELGVRGQERDKSLGGPDALVRGGYGRVPRQLARGLAIRTEHVVTRIQHGPSGVIVDTNRGRFEAARCVVSLPLAVLQSGRVVFSPTLPDEKRAVIGGLRMGTLDKVVLIMPRRVLPQGTDFLGRLGEEPTRFPLFLNIERLSGRPALIGFVAGQLARALEPKSDSEIIGQALRSLREMLGAGVPEPSSATVVRWSADPFAGGSYSYVPVGAWESDRDTLAAPVGDRLFFCGEATMRNYAGTVHGAFMSGLRAAARLAGAPAPSFPRDEGPRRFRSQRSRSHAP